MQAARSARGAVLALGLAAASAAPAPATRQSFEAVESVVAVEVPVQVTVGEEPLRGLTAADFELFDGKERQSISGFSVVDLGQLDPADPAFRVGDLPVSGRRHFLMLFDLAFAGANQLERAQGAARRVVTERLHPADLVGVAAYSAGRGPRMILGFTSDRQQVDLALATLGAPELIERSGESLALVLGAARAGLADKLAMWDPHVPAALSRGPAEQQDALRDAKEDFQIGYVEQTADYAAMEARQGSEVARNRAIAQSRAFADMARLLAGVDGRKFLLLFSEGFDSRLLLGDTAPVDTSGRGGGGGAAAAAAAATDEGRGALDSATLPRLDSDKLHGNTRLLNDLQQMITELRRADCVVEAVDIGGVRAAGEESSGQDTLFMLADGTGGTLHRNFNDLGQALQRTLARTAVTYVLSFQPRRLAPDGRFHELKVRLKKAPAGARVSHRAGYLAPLPGARQVGAQEKLALASLILGGRGGGDIGGWLAATPLEPRGGKTLVTLVAEIAGEDLLRGHEVGLLTTEFLAYAFDARGTVAGHFAQNVGLALTRVEERLRQTGLKFYGELELAPGTYDLRLLVRNGQTGRHGLLTARVEVPRLPGESARLLSPLFVDEMGRWVVAQSGGGAPYPLNLGGQPFVPAVAPALAEDAAVRLWMLGYGLGEGAPRVEATVATPDGIVRAGGRVVLTGSTPVAGAAPGAQEIHATFHPEGLLPGSYLLRLTAYPASGVAVESPAVPFQVVLPR